MQVMPDTETVLWGLFWGIYAGAVCWFVLAIWQDERGRYSGSTEPETEQVVFQQILKDDIEV